MSRLFHVSASTTPHPGRFFPFLILALLLLPACSPVRTLPVVSQPEALEWSRPLSDLPLRQTFVTPNEGADSIELVLALPESAPTPDSRPLDWEIRDNAGAVLREGVLETAGYLHGTPLRLQFERLPGGSLMELALTAPEAAEMALWTSSTDRYPQGTIIENGTNNVVDLHFQLYSQETPLTIPAELRAAAMRWRGAALWIPLLLLAPGWLLAWLARPAGARPIVPFVAGISLALAPIVYIWLGWTGLRLYEPLVQSLFQAAALALVLLMVRSPARVRDAWRAPWPDAMLVLGLAIILGVATWLLAARSLVAPAGESAVASGLLVQELVREGRLERFDAPLPPAIVAATLTQISRQPIPSTLLLAGLLAGVSLVPALYALGLEITEEPGAALSVVPLAWLWPAPWQALERGDLAALYGLALLPIAVALGLRALRARERPLRAVALATLPLAALMLVQGLFALGAWGIALALWGAGRVLRREPTPVEEATGEAEFRMPGRAPVSRVVGLALLWLVGAAILLVPAFGRGFTFENPSALPEGYALLGIAILLAAAAGWLVQRSGRMRIVLTTLVLLSLPLLLWWRSAPLEGSADIPTPSEVSVMEWARNGTPSTATFLINAEVDDDSVSPTGSGMWLPLYGNRSTILQGGIEPDLLARALEPGGLADEEVRESLRAAGVTHIFVGETGGPLRADDLLGQEWARVAFQSGSSYAFELLGTLPDSPPNEDDL
jgi:hypothetical protein